MLTDADFLILDGYNVINSWGALKALQEQNLEHARKELEERMASYGAFKGYKVVIVYDGQGQSGDAEEEILYKGLKIVFTTDGMTADSYIERLVYDILRRKKIVYVITGDYSEQLAILGSGAYRQSVRELSEDYVRAKKEMLSKSSKPYINARNELADRIANGEVLSKLEQLRRSMDK